MSAKQSPGTAELPGLTPAAFSGYFDYLLQTQAQFAESVQEAQNCAARVGQHFLQSVIENQRHALEIGKQMTESPHDVSGNLKALFDAATETQQRNIEAFNALIQEQNELSTKFGKQFPGLAGFNQGSPEFVQQWTKMWRKA